MHILVTRPAEDSKATVAALEASGHRASAIPLLVIEEETRADVGLDHVQTLLVTSANGIRAFASLSSRRDVNVMTVGAASATAARDLGFSDVVSADGDAAALATLAAGSRDKNAGRLIHLAGADAAGDLVSYLKAQGFDAERRVFYAARGITTMPTKLKSILDNAAMLDGILFYSGRTVQIFQTLVAGAEQVEACRRLTAYCLSPAIAKVAETLPFQRVKAAERPNEPSLLGLLE
jgi:uroporphyrinogen-III synthase